MLTEYQEELRLKRYGRYVRSFAGRKEEVFGDIREILDAVEKKDFEQDQDRKRESLYGREKEKPDDPIAKPDDSRPGKKEDVHLPALLTSRT